MPNFLDLVNSSENLIANSNINLKERIYTKFTNNYVINKIEKESENMNEFIQSNNIIDENIKTSTESLTQMILNIIIDYNGFGCSIYGIPGVTICNSNNDIQNYINNRCINYIHASNESSSLYMATYEAYCNKKVGITFSTAGPGTLMAITGLGNAYYESKPLICFFGVSVTNFQCLDRNIVTSLCKKIYYIDSNTINPQIIIKDAFTIAVNGTNESPGPGPVVIFILASCFNQTYFYTKNAKSLLLNNDHSKDIIDFSNKIFKNINPNSKVIINVSSKVDSELIVKIANLTNIYKNLFLTLSVLSRNYINPLDYPNVGILGPTRNKKVINLLKEATLVIDCGENIGYTEIIYSNLDSLINNEILLYSIQTNKQLYSNKNNILSIDVNKFLTIFIELYNKNITTPSPNSFWPDIRSSEALFNYNILNAYKNQTSSIDSKTVTTMSFIAQSFQAIYDNQKNEIDKNIIDDSLLYSTDCGSVSYLCQSFINCKNINSISLLADFSAMGSSISVVAGYLRTNKYTGAVIIIGDGGFLNVSSYLLDLCNVLGDNPNYSVLILLMNDNCYTSVADKEKLMFGSSTTITSTENLQKYIDIGHIAIANLGSTLKHYLKITELKSTSSPDLYNFVSNWYINRPHGVSLLQYDTIIGQPTAIYL
jgi:thiamine pyrophosphate-dependent acetolactate synthase large subunit-like protein